MSCSCPTCAGRSHPRFSREKRDHRSCKCAKSPCFVNPCDCRAENIDNELNCIAEAEFVVVGMGAGGAAALRTLHDAGFNVIGIEAGGNYDDDPLIKQSPNAPLLEEQYGYKFFYAQETEPNADINDKVLNWTSGRMAGGGSSINGMQYVRATDAIWAQWAALNGPQWSPSSVTAAYKALEKFDGVAGQFAAAQHGFAGNMLIRQAPTTATQKAIDFAAALALTTTPATTVISDYNDAATPIGTFTRWSLFQQPNGDRASSSTDFLASLVDVDGKPRANVKNVQVLQNTTVTRVLFDDQKRAYGVQVLRGGVSAIVRASKEVVLCAGIHSNEILQRSGVGPAAALEALGIPVVFGNDNVGAHLRNHLINFAVFSTPNNGPGVPASDPSALYVGGGFLPSPNAVDQTRRGFQWIGASASDTNLTVVFYNLDPLSEGTDRLQDSDPLRNTAVSEQLFSNPADLQRIVDVYQVQIAALATQLAAIDPLYVLVDPPATLLQPAQEEDLKEYIKDQIEHSHHFQSSNRAAPLAQGGVVAGDGTVHGVSRLRIADVSIAPVTTDGNTAGPAMLIGYIIAQQIVKKYAK